MLTNDQWQEYGIDWEAGLLEKGTLVIVPGVVSFRIVRNQVKGFSSFHQVCGSIGQRQFDTKQQIERYLECQIESRREYQRCIAKQNALRRRIAPLESKLWAVSTILSNLY